MKQEDTNAQIQQLVKEKEELAKELAIAKQAALEANDKAERAMLNEQEANKRILKMDSEKEKALEQGNEMVDNLIMAKLEFQKALEDERLAAENAQVLFQRRLSQTEQELNMVKGMVAQSPKVQATRGKKLEIQTNLEDKVE